MEQWEIKNRLKERIRDICTSMLPGGVFDTHYYRCGSVRGGKGDSCVVHLDGARRGEFFENSPKGDETFSSGSALDLLMAAQGISDVKEGFAAAARFLGVSTSRPNERVFKPSRTYSQPASEKKEYEPIKPMIETSPVSEGSQAWEYLVGERMLDPEILRKYRVAEGVFSFAVQTPDGSRQYKR
ncbi:MAG: hypothetical protein IJI37_05550, partial [Opitutales bacterium]|nr:hypothetical protein [Opitutales bacterium]